MKYNIEMSIFLQASRLRILDKGGVFSEENVFKLVQARRILIERAPSTRLDFPNNFSSFSLIVPFFVFSVFPTFFLKLSRALFFYLTEKSSNKSCIQLGTKA